jgi:tRNA(fMet)-specific endonuclease VapC
MKFLLDTNAVIAIFRGDEKMLARLRQHKPTDFGLPAIVLHELFYGATKSQRKLENVRRIEGLQFEVIELDAADARVAGEIRAQLAASGTPIGPYDILIAGQAVTRELTLITHNVGEFSRVSGLSLEDWEV